MSIVVDLPPQLEQELSIEAARDGVTPAEQAALILCLAGALLGEGPETPFRSAVRSFLSRDRIDPEHLSSALDQLKDLCLKAVPGLVSDLPAEESTERDRLGVLLRGWRVAAVHQPANVESNSTANESSRPAVHPGRPSIRGKYAYLGFGSEDHAREKQLEIDREDRI